MKINLERKGGFAGMRITVMLDAELMPLINLLIEEARKARSGNSLKEKRA